MTSSVVERGPRPRPAPAPNRSIPTGMTARPRGSWSARPSIDSVWL